MNLMMLLLVKILVCLSTTEADELHLKHSIIEGYESAGAVFDTNNIMTVNHINTAGKLKEQLDYALTNGYELVIHNWGGQEDYSTNAVSEYYFNGIQIICPGGANEYHTYRSDLPLPSMILCGAGDTSNHTSYNIEFFSGHPYSNYPILSMTKNGGDTVTVVVDVTTNGAFQIFEGYAVKLSGITGWQHNPNGILIAVPAGYDRFKIIYNVGTGSFSSGTAKLFFESYSHAYIAGIFARLRDSLNCSNWDARYRMRMTGSNMGSTTTYEGYGKPSLSAALAWSGTIPDDPYNTLGSIGNLSATRIDNRVYIILDSVSNATRYQIFDNTTLLSNIQYSNQVFGLLWFLNSYNYTISRTKRDAPHQFWYRAFRDTIPTFESNKITIQYPQFKKFKIKH